MNEKREMYLGDAVYAEIERGMVKLTTRDGYPPPGITNTIYLEPEIAFQLHEYLGQVLAEMVAHPVSGFEEPE